MIRPLRKYHLLVWTLWAVLLPAAFIFAMALRPDKIKPINQSGVSWRASVSSSNDSTAEVHITLLELLPGASCVVIQKSERVDVLLGRLDHPGDYTFTLQRPQGDVTLVLYDVLRGETLQSLVLPLHP